MKMGFSTLSLIMKSIDDMLEEATIRGFDSVEFLCEAHMHPRYLLKDKEKLEAFKSYDLDVYIHGTTVDLNLASLNEGVRNESKIQSKECLELASEIGAKAVTTHPGKIGRRDDVLRKVALDFAIESIKELTDYADELGTKISIENMPERFSFLGNKVEELEKIREETNCSITIDLGHANTCSNPEEFTKIPGIIYYHLNDNNGIKDQHLPIGEGTLDLNLLKKVDNGIIELNKFDNVLKSKKVIEEFLNK